MKLTIIRRISALFAVILAATVTVPSAASAHGYRGGATFGYTALALDPGTAGALTSLGVTPGVVAPATQAGDGSLQFPITDSLTGAVLRGGTINHSGGISLTAGNTTVNLTNFNINLLSRTLSADVGGSRVTILNLDFAKSHVSYGFGAVTIGPVAATLTRQAATALNGAFNVSAFTQGLLLGQATVHYQLFPSW